MRDNTVLMGRHGVIKNTRENQMLIDIRSTVSNSGCVLIQPQFI